LSVYPYPPQTRLLTNLACLLALRLRLARIPPSLAICSHHIPP
jgi:hypothetical protein